MNIHGYKLKIKRAREDLKKERIGARECFKRMDRARRNIERLRKERAKKK